MEFDGIVGLLLLGVWLFAIFDVISTDNASVRNLPKPLWLLLVIVLPDVGAIAWLFLGRPVRAGATGPTGSAGTGGARPAATPVRRPRVRPRPSAREEEAEFRARIEARDRMLAQWAEEDRRKAESSPATERPPVSRSPLDQDEVDERVRQLEADLAREDPDRPS